MEKRSLKFMEAQTFLTSISNQFSTKSVPRARHWILSSRPDRARDEIRLTRAKPTPVWVQWHLTSQSLNKRISSQIDLEPRSDLHISANNLMFYPQQWVAKKRWSQIAENLFNAIRLVVCKHFLPLKLSLIKPCWPWMTAKPCKNFFPRKDRPHYHLNF